MIRNRSKEHSALKAILGWDWWQHADVCDYADPCQCGFSELDRAAREALQEKAPLLRTHDAAIVDARSKPTRIHDL
jgi:hypothetical protein